MRKLISFMHVSLDGFVTGPNEDMNWLIMDEEIFQDAMELEAGTEIALYGRVTYEMMLGYWPTVLCNPLSTAPEIRHARWVENVSKIVVSETLEEAGWHNATLMRGNIPAEIAELKNRGRGNMMIFGSPTLTHSFLEWDLIDEFKLNINPVILGKGVSLFGNVMHRKNLELISGKKFSSGVIGLHYQAKDFNH